MVAVRGAPVKLMCLNAWGGTLHATLLPFVAAAAPDILCLQEVVKTPGAGSDWLTYRDGDHVLPQRANLFDEVAAALPGHLAIFCPAAQGELWEGERAIASQWGIATFVRRGLTVIGQVQGFVHKDYSPDGYGAHPRSRNAHGVRVHDPAAGRVVAVTHMHGLRDLRGKMDTPERRAQAERLLALARGLAEPDDLAVICGDFNVEPESETLRMLAEAGFAELVTGGGHAGTRSTRYAKPGKFADYMLVNRPAAVRGFAVLREPEVSDHCPLLLEL